MLSTLTFTAEPLVFTDSRHHAGVATGVARFALLGRSSLRGSRLRSSTVAGWPFFGARTPSLLRFSDSSAAKTRDCACFPGGEAPIPCESFFWTRDASSQLCRTLDERVSYAVSPSSCPRTCKGGIPSVRCLLAWPSRRTEELPSSRTRCRSVLFFPRSPSKERNASRSCSPALLPCEPGYLREYFCIPPYVTSTLPAVSMSLLKRPGVVFGGLISTGAAKGEATCSCLSGLHLCLKDSHIFFKRGPSVRSGLRPQLQVVKATSGTFPFKPREPKRCGKVSSFYDRST